MRQDNKISNIFKKSLHYIKLGDIIILTEIERVG